MYGIIYCATNNKNGKKYIGQTINSLQYRKQQHITSALRNCNSYFYNSLIKYNFDFTWEVLETCESLLELNEKEIYYIALFNTFLNESKGYNLTAGGEGNKKYPFSNEEVCFLLNKRREKLGYKEILKSFNKTYNRNLTNVFSITNVIKKIIPEVEEKEIIHLVRCKSFNRVETEQSRVNRSKAQLGKKASVETLKKMRLVRLGCSHTMKSREYMKSIHPRTIRFTEEQKQFILDCLDKKYSKRIIREELAKVFGIIFTTESPIRRAIKEIAQAKPNKH